MVIASGTFARYTRIKLIHLSVVEVFKTFDHENNGLMNTSELNDRGLIPWKISFHR